MKNCFGRICRKKGFTLVELVVVVGIAAVLMAIVLTSLLNGNTEDILSANANARSFFTASQLTLTNAQLTERSLVDYGSSDVKYIEYKDGVNTLNGKYLFIEAKYTAKGVEGVHVGSHLNEIMSRDDTYSDMTILEKYMQSYLDEYMTDSYDGYFYAMCDDEFKVMFTHYCELRLPEYTSQSLSEYREEFMVGAGTKLADSPRVLGTCSDKYYIPETGELGVPETGDYAFGIPRADEADFSKYLSN